MPASATEKVSTDKPKHGNKTTTRGMTTAGDTASTRKPMQISFPSNPLSEIGLD
ncbi:hypothetical protein JYU34_008949 [Plutella xylostella]|uniref:Uncharacterized protein n=1 Tax=Plutella xylostella TaxID=51655 RepID=A0ABQ7QMN5_PLUXY|nr:hypothetical protein JYU34_008949 [Plutella xylostella]